MLKLVELPLILATEKALALICKGTLDWVMTQIPGARRGAFAVYDPKSNKLALRASIPEGVPPISRTLIKKAAADGCGFIWSQGDALVPLNESMQSRSIASGMYVSLLCKEKIRGVICVDNEVSAGVFSPDSSHSSKTSEGPMFTGILRTTGK